MARPSLPLGPRVSAPDLPRELVDAQLSTRGDLHGAWVRGASGVVDAAHAQISDSRLSAIVVDSLDLTGCTLTDVDIDALCGVTVTSRESRWQSVRITGGRVATLDLSRSDLIGVEIRGLRIDYLSMAGGAASDLLFVDCVIGAWDAPQSKLSRVRFEACRVDEVDNRDWRVENVDLRGLDAARYLSMAALRGATLTEQQVTALGRDFAAAAGVDVRG